MILSSHRLERVCIVQPHGFPQPSGGEIAQIIGLAFKLAQDSHAVGLPGNVDPFFCRAPGNATHAKSDDQPDERGLQDDDPQRHSSKPDIARCKIAKYPGSTSRSIF